MGLRSILPWTVATMAMVAGVDINRDNGQRAYPHWAVLFGANYCGARNSFFNVITAVWLHQFKRARVRTHK